VKWVGKVARHPFVTTLVRIHKNIVKQTEPGQEEYDPWAAWEEAKEKNEELLGVEDLVGRIPKPGLNRLWGSRAWRKKAVWYAVRDADATGRCGEKVWAENGEVGKEVYKVDYDK